MELISRKAVYEMLHGLGGCDASGRMVKGWDKAIRYSHKELDKIPTAYDVDKVVESLMNNTCSDEDKCYFIPEEAIRIVKGGGQG